MAGDIVCCIYRIRNLVNGKVYVGSAVNFRKRWNNHLVALRLDRHHSRKLQAAWNKYGEHSFAAEPFEIVENKAHLVVREQFWIDALQPFYNCSPTAGSAFGVKHSAATRAKVSAALSGVPKPKRSREHAANLAESLRGKKRGALSDETKRKISIAHTGKTGRVTSEETKAKLSLALSGRKQPERSASHRSALSLAMKGRKANPEGVRKSAATRTGVPMSDAAKRNMSVAAKLRGVQANLSELGAAANRGRKQDPEVVARRTASIKATWERKRQEKLQAA
jgi:group I intron endonuclease